MKPYINQTVLDLNVHIERLTLARDTLLTLNVEVPPELKLPPGLPPLADLDAPMPERVTKPAPRKAAKAPPRASAPEASSERLTVKGMCRHIIRGWAGEFRQDALQSALTERYPASAEKIKLGLGCACRNFVVDGELEFKRREGRFPVYQRTKKFSPPSESAAPQAAAYALLNELHTNPASKS